MTLYSASTFYPTEVVGRSDQLDQCLEDILALVKPTSSDETKRLNFISELTNLVQSVESLRGAGVRPFGSFVSGLYTKWGDLDISIELSHSSPTITGKRRKLKVLRDIMRMLQQSGVTRDITIIPQAKVPVITFESIRYEVSCDICVDNHMGYMKSRILKWIAEIDDRFRDVIFLIKEWAKAQSINDPKSGSLNSFSLCLLVIFHFQTCNPAILPPLKDIYEGNIGHLTGTLFSLDRHITDVCAANIARFKSSRQRNGSTVRHLLISFFEKFFNIETISLDYAICTYTGQLERISSSTEWMGRPYNLIIEDPFDRVNNAARAVSVSGIVWISDAFVYTRQRLSSKSVLSDRKALLAILVRPNIRSQVRFTLQGYEMDASLREPLQTEYLQEQVQRMTLGGRNQTSPSAVAQQQQWRPRNSNR